MVKTKPQRVHDATLTIRANRELIDRARQAAREQGMTLSEALRQRLRDLAAERPSSELIALVQEVIKGTAIARMTPEELEDSRRRFDAARRSIDNSDSEA